MAFVSDGVWNDSAEPVFEGHKYHKVVLYIWKGDPRNDARNMELVRILEKLETQFPLMHTEMELFLDRMLVVKLNECSMDENRRMARIVPKFPLLKINSQESNEDGTAVSLFWENYMGPAEIEYYLSEMFNPGRAYDDDDLRSYIREERKDLTTLHLPSYVNINGWLPFKDKDFGNTRKPHEMLRVKMGYPKEELLPFMDELDDFHPASMTDTTFFANSAGSLKALKERLFRSSWKPLQVEDIGSAIPAEVNKNRYMRDQLIRSANDRPRQHWYAAEGRKANNQREMDRTIPSRAPTAPAVRQPTAGEVARAYRESQQRAAYAPPPPPPVSARRPVAPPPPPPPSAARGAPARGTNQIQGVRRGGAPPPIPAASGPLRHRVAPRR